MNWDSWKSTHSILNPAFLFQPIKALYFITQLSRDYHVIQDGYVKYTISKKIPVCSPQHQPHMCHFSKWPIGYTSFSRWRPGSEDTRMVPEMTEHHFYTISKKIPLCSPPHHHACVIFQNGRPDIRHFSRWRPGPKMNEWIRKWPNIIFHDFEKIPLCSPSVLPVLTSFSKWPTRSEDDRMNPEIAEDHFYMISRKKIHPRSPLSPNRSNVTRMLASDWIKKRNTCFRSRDVNKQNGGFKMAAPIERY